MYIVRRNYFNWSIVQIPYLFIPCRLLMWARRRIGHLNQKSLICRVLVEGARMPAYSYRISIAMRVFQFWWCWEVPCRACTKGYMGSLWELCTTWVLDPMKYVCFISRAYFQAMIFHREHASTKGFHPEQSNKKIIIRRAHSGFFFYIKTYWLHAHPQ